MTASLTSVLAGSLQLAVVTAVAWLTVFICRVRAPRALLLHYQIALLAGLVLPLVSAVVPQVDQPAAVWKATSVIAAIDGTAGPDSSRLASCLAVILLVGIGARALWLVAGFMRLRRYRQSPRPFDHLPAAVAVLQSTLGIRARWFAGDQVPSAATYGIRRPVVLLPAHVASLPDAMLQMVACHELVHIARRDWIAVVAEEIVRTLFWFHPAIWFLLDRIRLHREQVVDERVVAALGDRRAYASALLDLVGSDNALQPQLVSGWLQSRHLRARIHTIMRGGSMSTRRLALTATFLAATLATTGVWAAQAFPVQSGAGADERVYTQADGAVLPQPTRQVKPEYTKEAMQYGIEGSMAVSLIVKSDGTLSDLKVVRSLDTDYGLDDQGLVAARQWAFRPGTKDGKPVAVRIELEFRFTLK